MAALTDEQVTVLQRIERCGVVLQKPQQDAQTYDVLHELGLIEKSKSKWTPDGWYITAEGSAVLQGVRRSLSRDQLDLIAKPTDHVAVEVLPEVGVPGAVKLYVHVNGITVFRMCKVDREQLTVRKP